jgi:hypothetical protein
MLVFPEQVYEYDENKEKNDGHLICEENGERPKLKQDY